MDQKDLDRNDMPMTDTEGTNPYQNPYYVSQDWNSQMNQGPQMNQYMQQPVRKKKHGFGVLLGKCAAIAVVCGLVAGGTFGAVNLGIKQFSSRSENTSSQETGENSSDSAAEKEKVSIEIKKTSSAAEVSGLSDVSKVAEEVMPSIVAITNVGTLTYNYGYFGSETYEAQSCGSGVIINKDKEYLYIVTNNHVVANANQLSVQFCDESTVSAEITGTDSADDLAVVQVRLSSIEKDTLNVIKQAVVGDSEALKVGASTIAIGNALGYGQSVTTGIVSALGRTVSSTDDTTGQVITNTNLIQTDAAINPGNSGGALLNGNGEVIGINSAKYADTAVEGIGYAIPMADAVPIIEALINNEKIPQTAYLGIHGQDVSADMQRQLNMPSGVYVAQVIQGSAAEEAGIYAGDIITKLEGKEVSSMNLFRSKIAGYKEGDSVKLTVARMKNGQYKEIEIEVKLGGQSTVAE